MRTIGIVVLVFAALAAGAASSVRADETNGSFSVLIERDPDRLETRLQSAAARGFRLAEASDGDAGFTRSNEVRLYLRRSTSGSAPEYRLLRGPFSGEIEDRLNRLAREGFRLTRPGILRKATPNPLGHPGASQADTVLLILERSATGPPLEYRLLSPGTPKQFDREVERAHRRGFTLTGLHGFSGGWILTVMQRPIVEKEYGVADAEDEPRYIALTHAKRPKLFEKVGEAAADGYRIFDTVHDGFVGGGDVVILERVASPGRPYSYYFLGNPSPQQLEQRLDEGAAAGYRFQPGLDPAVELIMERAPDDGGSVRYRTVAGATAAEIERQVDVAASRGLRWVGSFGESMVLEVPTDEEISEEEEVTSDSR